jgi:molybdate transport system ATP-binding protein
MNVPGIKARFQLVFGEFHFDVDLALPGSGITVLLGESGCGKTTLLRCMAGLEQPSQGFFAVNGETWQDSKQNCFLPTHRRNIGYVFQDANLFPHLTVAENLLFGLKRIRADTPITPGVIGTWWQKRFVAPKTAIQPIEDNNENFNAIVALLGLGHLLDRKPDRLSGGEKQRVAIARALVLNPAILLMDEPLASLDGKRKQEVMPFLQKLHQDLRIPLIYVTHSQDEAAQLADFLVLMDKGKIQAAGSASATFGRIDLPLAQDRQAAVIWEGVIARHEPEYNLSQATFGGKLLNLPLIDRPVGAKIRVQLLARDVSLTLQPPEMSSILNILPATVTNLNDIHLGQCVVQLQVGGEILLSHITQKSRQLLALKGGMEVYVQIKGSSLLH